MAWRMDDLAPLAVSGLGGAALGVALAVPFDLYLWANAAMLLGFGVMEIGRASCRERV